jgi:SAM-dependent methyltransferase
MHYRSVGGIIFVGAAVAPAGKSAPASKQWEGNQMHSLASIYQELHVDEQNKATKPLSYYFVYERYFAENRNNYKNICEVGVFTGESLKVFSRYFSEAKIIGIDLERREIDFDGFPNICYVQADQRDGQKLLELANLLAPSGFDVIIDDASHLGYYSLQTFITLFQRLRTGGLYVIEDWGTGYWDDWEDGSRYRICPSKVFDRAFPKRIPSHDFGMVGLIKRLVDIVGLTAIRPRSTDPVGQASPFEYMHLYPEMAIIKKKSDYNFDPENLIRAGDAMGLPVDSSVLAPLEVRNRSLEAEIEAMKRSRSWRITKPLRSAISTLRGGRGSIFR